LRGEGWEAYAGWWKDPACKIVHFIGEDNIVFHAITFPAMLAATHGGEAFAGAAGEYQLPHNVVANSFLNIKFPGKDEEKMSKSRGTAIWIEDYLKTFDPDPLRYYLTAVAPEQQRAAFDVDEFLNKNNTELLNVLGNFVNRTVTFAHKYFEGKVPEPSERDPADLAHIGACRKTVAATGERLERCQFKAALAEVMGLARAGNAYFDATAPFKSRKTDLAACGRAINVCLQTVRTLTTLIGPFLPFSAAKCLAMMRLDESGLRWDEAVRELPAGHGLGPAEILFKKLDPGELFGEA
jgi:methionyl-tRNA synthetase